MGNKNQYTSPNLDFLCLRQSEAALFCENYAKLYFDAKQKRDWVGGGKIFGALFLKKVLFLATALIGRCPNFLD